LLGEGVIKGELEYREYQWSLAKACLEEDTLVVMPTGMGKTVVALLAMAELLRSKEGAKVIFMAPSKPLVHQHYEFLKRMLSARVEETTGEDRPDSRSKVWEADVVCATPQVVENDALEGRLSLERVDMLIFDEAHRAVGSYPYVKVSRLYKEARPDGRRMGLTASLPNEEDKVREIMLNLGLKRIEFRDERSPDVRPYVKGSDLEVVKVELPPIFKRIFDLVKGALDDYVKALADAKLLKPRETLSMKKLLDLRGKVEELGDRRLRAYLLASIKLSHALMLFETQGLEAFVEFMERTMARKGAASRLIRSDERILEAYEVARGAKLLGMEHPKLKKLLEILKGMKEGERAMVFASYRSTVGAIHSYLLEHGIRAGYLIGKGRSGQSQKEQVEVLNRLKDGEIDVLVATQVGEEGLDVSECKLVVFYDGVPSAIRFIQRKGRTGRRERGRVVLLLTEGTRDELYYRLSRRRLKWMKRVVRRVGERMGPLDSYLEAEGPIIHMDVREPEGIAERLRALGARLSVERLDVGDYVLSKDVVVERKELGDFVKSVMDGRLFEQAVKMKEAYPIPILVIQGRRSSYGISRGSFFGAISSLLADFQIPIFTASNEDEVASLLYYLASREQREKKKEVRVREGLKPKGLPELQRYVIAGIPGIDFVLADRLLKRFGSVKAVFNATEEELMEVEGIGEKLAKRIREIASKPYSP